MTNRCKTIFLCGVWTGLMAVLFFPAGCGEKAGPASRLVVGIEAGPDNLDPRIGNSLGASRVHQLVFNRLVLLDEKGLPVPDLAERWERTDETTYVFHLREGIRFHDGRPCTSKDVVYTYRTILDGTVISAKKAALDVIDRIEARGENSVSFHLKEPFSPFLANLSIGIIPEGAGPDFGRHPAGTGPYALKEHLPEQQLLLEANPDYFGGAPHYREILLRIIPNAGTRALELEKGSIDMVVNDLNPDDVVRFGGLQNLQILTETGTNYHYIGFNMRDPLLKHKKVRQAIGHAVDRDKIIRTILQDLAVPATGLLAPNNWAYNPDVYRFRYDPDLARKLLDDAGFPDPDGDGPGTRFSLTFKTSTNKLSKQKAEIYKEYLRNIGIDLSIRSFEWATFYSDIKKGDFQIYSLIWTGIEHGDIYRTRFHSAAVPPFGFNRGHYSNPEVDGLIEQSSRTLETDALKEIYGRIQAIIAEEAPYISLWYGTNVAVMQKGIAGFRLTPNASFRPLAQTYLEGRD
jgi:peptide/nickel transport system substrate-binding protein